MEIVGLKENKFTTGHREINYYDDEFEYYYTTEESHVLYGIGDDKQKYVITLKVSKENSNRWGIMDISIVDNFKNSSHVPIKPLFVDENTLFNRKYQDVKNEVFECIYDGGDDEYPFGYYEVNMSLFKENEKRAVWLFDEYSELFTSPLIQKLKGMTICDVSSCSELPEIITADIVVFDYSELENVMSRISDGDEFWKVTVSGKHPLKEEKRTVWLINGDGNLYRSPLLEKLKGLSVYETNSNPELPEKFKDDVVICGYKYNFRLDELKSRIPDDAEMCFITIELIEY